jgi:ribosomal protein S18 acetylase RimI-like enzyme
VPYPSVRRATADDLGPLADLFDQDRQFYDQPADLAQAHAFMAARMERGESVVFIGLDPQGAIAGFCQLYPSFCSVAAAPILVLYDLFVAPGARRLGLAKALMLAAQKYATAHGVARMDLTTAHTNTRAQALYESLGWQLDTVFRAYTWTPPDN